MYRKERKNTRMPFVFFWHCFSFSQQCHLSVLHTWIYLGGHVNDMYMYYLFLLFIFFFPGLCMNLQQHCLGSLVLGPILFKIKGKIMLGNGVSPERSFVCCPDIANEITLWLLILTSGVRRGCSKCKYLHEPQGRSCVLLLGYHRGIYLSSVRETWPAWCEFTQQLQLWVYIAFRMSSRGFIKRSRYFHGTIIQGPKDDSYARNFTALLCCVTSMPNYHPETSVKTPRYQ